MKNKGFTIIELLVTVGLVGIITTIAVGTYKVKFPTAQVKEPVNMLEQQRLTITTGISQGYCTPNNDPITMKGKYGVITVSGTLKPSAGQSCPSGCQAKYTFNGSDVSKELQGKIIVVDVLNNLKMSKVTAQTTVDDKYLPKNLIAYSVNAGDSCTAIAATTATATSGGGTSGTENAVANGSVIPGEPVVPTPTPTAPPTTPTTPTEPTTPSPPSEGSSTAPPSEPTLQEQVERAKTFRVDMGGSTNADVRHTARATIVIPRGEHADYYQPGNWNVNDWNTNRFYVDWDNTNWRNNKFIKDSYVISIYTNNSNMIRRRVYSTYCAEGGGCYNYYEYVHTLNLYYKGQYIRTYNPVSRVPEPDAGTN